MFNMLAFKIKEGYRIPSFGVLGSSIPHRLSQDEFSIHEDFCQLKLQTSPKVLGQIFNTQLTALPLTPISILFGQLVCIFSLMPWQQI